MRAFTVTLLLCALGTFGMREQAHGESAPPDEELLLSVTAWGLPVAKGKVQIWNEATFEGRRVGRILAQGSTTGIFYLLHRVEDTMESVYDTQTFLPHWFRVHFEEGAYRRIEEYRFEQQAGKIVDSRGVVLPLAGPAYDPLSALMFLRAQELSDGVSMTRNVSDGKSVYSVSADVVGSETRRALGGNIPCWIIEPKLAHVELGGLLKDKKFSRFVAWLTKGTSRIPVLAQGQLFMGVLQIKLRDRRLPTNARAAAAA